MRRKIEDSMNLNANKNPEMPKRRRKLNDEQIQAQIDKSIKIVNEYSKKNDEIRRSRAGKTLPEYRNEIEKENKKIEIKITLGTKIKAGIFIFVVGIIAYLFAKYSSIIGISINKQADMNEFPKIDIVTTVDDVYTQYQNELLVYSNQIIKTYDKNGNVSWKYELQEKFNPDIFVNNEYMAVSNNSLGKIYFFKNKKEVYNKKIDGEIENIFIDDSGTIAIEYSTSGYKKILGVYSKDGNHLYNAYLSSDAILGLKLMDNANKILIITANTASFKVGMNVSILNVNDENSKPELVVSLENNFMYDYLVKNNKLYLILDNSIVSVDLIKKESNVIKEFNSSQILYVSLNDNYYSYVEKNIESGIGYSKKTCNFSGKEIGVSNISDAPKMYDSNGLVDFIVYQNKLEMYNKWGINIKNVLINYPPKNIIPFRDGRSVALIYTNKIFVISI